MIKQLYMGDCVPASLAMYLGIRQEDYHCFLKRNFKQELREKFKNGTATRRAFKVIRQCTGKYFVTVQGKEFNRNKKPLSH